MQLTCEKRQGQLVINLWRDQVIEWWTIYVCLLVVPFKLFTNYHISKKFDLRAWLASSWTVLLEIVLSSAGHSTLHLVMNHNKSNWPILEMLNLISGFRWRQSDPSIAKWGPYNQQVIYRMILCTLVKLLLGLRVGGGRKQIRNYLDINKMRILHNKKPGKHKYGRRNELISKKHTLMNQEKLDLTNKQPKSYSKKRLIKYTNI